MDLATSNYPEGLVAHSTQVGDVPYTKMTIENDENLKVVRRCAECVLFATHKCTQRLKRVPVIPENKKRVFDFSVPGTWRKYLDWVFTYEPIVVERYEWIAYPIFKTDLACGDFILFR